MMSVNCKDCNANIVWPENYIKGQRPLNMDGSVHSCIATETSAIPLPDIVDGHTRLFAKLIHRIETLEKKIDKK